MSDSVYFSFEICQNSRALILSKGVMDMKWLNWVQTKKWVLFPIISLLLLWIPSNRAGQEASSALSSLLPDVEGMETQESPDIYFPETLFEYINGAAEIYLSYDFKELIVAEYTDSDSSDSVVVEIYDMGNHKNSFGIYSAERYPDSDFMDLGTQGYMEEGALNFLVGNYYVKLFCYDCKERSEQWLRTFSNKIVSRVDNKAGFPSYLETFPREGLIPNTERFILKNVMGYKFLHDGYVVSYKASGVDFDCFLIEGENAEEAAGMLKKYLDAKGTDSAQKTSRGFRINDRYYHNIFIAQVDNILCGVMKIPDDYSKVGEDYLQRFVRSVKNR
jgi:hypothetical protein